ncbi:putative entry exclusion protein TrbK-alt [Pseudodonghicola xiamenensis]|uniref:putative entry exclusion protein TrbK-alt n=1 Tax=Pseudodonghicola xiamenensis TaxID=337702 RepID=UPI0003F9E29B|nr:putative entry exclusion protein TrbK-alt [Pseudodonghicola xiamenensis]
MEGKVLARIAAIVFVAIAITATVIEMTREDAPVPASTAPALQPSADPLRATLRRCQQLGEAAASDADCLAAWAESRDRFLGRTPAPSTPAASNTREGQ